MYGLNTAVKGDCVGMFNDRESRKRVKRDRRVCRGVMGSHGEKALGDEEVVWATWNPLWKR